MELKPMGHGASDGVRNLLIVPYGIETQLDHCSEVTSYLLIVPYGIETIEKMITIRLSVKLLIVPYGIETQFEYVLLIICTLLIVPYGIETIIPCMCILPSSPF